jgi:ATP-dependent Clp protease adapter protein ClpS
VIAEHALVGACDAPFFRAPLEAAGVDVDALGRALDGMLTSRRFASAKLGAVETLVQLACLHANIIGADAPSLGRLIVDLLRNPHVTRSLAARGFVAYDLLFSFVHREPPDPRNEAVGGRAELVLHDDPFSTMEHVVKVLRDVFALSEAESQKTMLAVHEGGSASLGTFDVEEATRRRDAVRATSRVAGMPLRVVLRASP